MSPRTPRRLVLAVVAAALIGVVGCLSPTLPLPPPGRPDIDGPDQQGQVTLRGHVESRAEVIALNLAKTSEGDARFAGPDGAYELRFGADVGDRIRLYYRSGSLASEPIEFVIPDPLR